tara:strand:- start:616 stop:1128 length:513 start_codon:yes stop_codon:yes gene_type:complete
MSYVQISKSTITSPTANVDITGITDTNIYMLSIRNLTSDNSSGGHAIMRVLDGGTPDTNSIYSQAEYNIRSDTTHSIGSRDNQTYWFISHLLSTTTQSQHNTIIFLYDFHVSDQNSYIVNLPSDWRSSAALFSRLGSSVHKADQSNNGVRIQMDNGNINTAEITLYKVLT